MNFCEALGISSLDCYFPISHQLLIEHAHTLHFNPSSFYNIILIPHFIKMLIKILIEFLSGEVEVDTDQFSGGTISTRLINPVVSVPSHATGAGLLGATATFNCFEWVLVVESFIFGEGEPLINQILH